MSTHRALVTGATSGLGFEAAAQLAEDGWSHVTITGRTAERAERASVALVERTGRDVFDALIVDLGDPTSTRGAVSELARRGDVFDFLLLNAGMVSGNRKITTEAGVEQTFASSLIGHHELATGILETGLLADGGRIVIAGSEAARGDVPTFNPTDLRALAAERYGDDLTVAAEALIRGTAGPFKSAKAYADAKVFVAWWVASLARRLPEGAVVNAVSPGSVPETGASRNAQGFMKYVMLPVFKLTPSFLGMKSSVDIGARRYLDVAGMDDAPSGAFFASAPKKMTGPIEVMEHPHLHDEEVQEAVWRAIVRVAGGADYPTTV